MWPLDAETLRLVPKYPQQESWECPATAAHQKEQYQLVLAKVLSSQSYVSLKLIRSNRFLLTASVKA